MPAQQAGQTMGDYNWLPADLRDFIARTQSFDPPEGVAADIAAQRAGYDRMCVAMDTPAPDGLERRDLTLGGVPCREYLPAGQSRGAQPPVLYFHGGGFVLGGLHSHDSICADLAQSVGAELIAVDYRLAPEHPHPAAFEDALAVLRAFGRPVVLVGDSAGATLAAAVAAQTDRPGVLGQVLIYPGLGGGDGMPAMRAHAEAPLLRAADILAYQAFRTAAGDGADDPTAQPLRGERFDHLPPCVAFAAECDPLASDAWAYVSRLVAAGVPARLVVEPFLVHGYLRARADTATGRAAFGRIAAAVAGFLDG